MAWFIFDKVHSGCREAIRGNLENRRSVVEGCWGNPDEEGEMRCWGLGLG